MLKGKEKELIEAAGGLAAHRLKTNFILHRIAEKEEIKVTRQDLDERIRHQAMHANTTPEKMRHEIEQHDQMNGLIEQVLLSKTIAFLGSNATVDGTPAPAETEPISE
jgi:trigger factor